MRLVNILKERYYGGFKGCDRCIELIFNGMAYREGTFGIGTEKVKGLCLIWFHTI